MAKELPFETGSFDYLISIEGIEHIENQFLFLRECSRILKKGGKLFLTTPNVSSHESRFTFFITGYHDNPPGPIRNDLQNIFMEHINLIPFHRLEIFLRFAGFEIQKLTAYRMRKGSLFFYPFILPISVVRNWILYRKGYKGRMDEKYYWNIFKMYSSKEVLCGDSNIVVAVKK